MRITMKLKRFGSHIEMNLIARGFNGSANIYNDGKFIGVWGNMLYNYEETKKTYMRRFKVRVVV